MRIANIHARELLICGLVKRAALNKAYDLLKLQKANISTYKERKKKKKRQTGFLLAGNVVLEDTPRLAPPKIVTDTK